MTALLDLIPRFDWQRAPLPIAALWDESAHLITTAVILLALLPRATRAFAGGALVASVLIDVDHLPLMLGWMDLTDGTPRPLSHSIATSIALLLLAAAVRAPYRLMLGGAAFGVLCHLLRDAATGGVVLFWPFSHRAVELRWELYVVLLGALASIAASRRLWHRATAGRGVTVS